MIWPNVWFSNTITSTCGPALEACGLELADVDCCTEETGGDVALDSSGAAWQPVRTNRSRASAAEISTRRPVLPHRLLGEGVDTSDSFVVAPRVVAPGGEAEPLGGGGPFPVQLQPKVQPA